MSGPRRIFRKKLGTRRQPSRVERRLPPYGSFAPDGWPTERRAAAPPTTSRATPSTTIDRDIRIFRHFSVLLGTYKSITYSACRPSSPAHQGAILAHPIWVGHIPGTTS